MIRETTDKVRMIRGRLKVVQSRKKSYANSKKREIEFKVSEYVFLKVPPRHSITRFGVKGKLAILDPSRYSKRLGIWLIA